MPKKYNYMKILKTGTFKDKAGKEVTITDKDLDKIIESTDLSKEPQLVIEHPVFDLVGHGTITELKKVGDSLFALPAKVNEKFKDAVNSGLLPGRSIRLDEKTLALDHIGFLPPSIKPAVDGLGAYMFSQADEKTDYYFNLPGVESHFAEVNEDKIDFASFEISGWPFRNIQQLFRSIKNYLIEKEGLEKADSILNEYSIQDAGNAPVVFDKPMNYSFSQNIKGDPMKIDFSSIDFSKPDQLKATVKALIDENQELNTNNEKLKTDLQSAQNTITAEQKAKDMKEVMDFCESPEMVKKILPAEKDQIVQLLLASKEKGKIEFSSGENKKEVNPYELLKAQLKLLPDKIELSEMANNSNGASQSKPDYVKVGDQIASMVNNSTK